MDQMVMTLPYDIDTACRIIRQPVAQHGLLSAQSFHLEQACASFSNPVCPHDGSTHCSCRLATLHIGLPGEPALSLVLHKHDGKTEIWLDSEELASVPALAAQVQQALAASIHLHDMPGWTCT
ncbi:MAG: hypothetical protein EHM70_05280 [Chloroflexota bacterium]|nr:MAG: hypothetical protein EHM70_05280 [Chloroflexota bacterium]